MNPKVYYATSSQHVVQHHKCRKCQRGEEIRLRLSHDGCAQTELVLRPAEENWGMEQCALMFLFSLGSDNWATTDFSGSRTKSFALECVRFSQESLLDDL